MSIPPLDSETYVPPSQEETRELTPDPSADTSGSFPDVVPLTNSPVTEGEQPEEEQLSKEEIRLGQKKSSHLDLINALEGMFNFGTSSLHFSYLNTFKRSIELEGAKLTKPVVESALTRVGDTFCWMDSSALVEFLVEKNRALVNICGRNMGLLKNLAAKMVDNRSRPNDKELALVHYLVKGGLKVEEEDLADVLLNLAMLSYSHQSSALIYSLLDQVQGADFREMDANGTVLAALVRCFEDANVKSPKFIGEMESLIIWLIRLGFGVPKEFVKLFPFEWARLKGMNSLEKELELARNR